MAKSSSRAINRGGQQASAKAFAGDAQVLHRVRQNKPILPCVSWGSILVDLAPTRPEMPRLAAFGQHTWFMRVSTASLIRAKHQNSLPLPTRGADKAEKRGNFGATLLVQRHIEAHLRAFSVLKDTVRKFEAI